MVFSKYGSNKYVYFLGIGEAMETSVRIFGQFSQSAL